MALAGSRSQFAFELADNGIDPTRPLIYLWQIFDGADEPIYAYVGKANDGARRPLTHYRRNVTNLLDGRPYRRSKPDGFRLVHRRLADAVRANQRIVLTYLANVGSDEDIFERERHWQREYGADPLHGIDGADSVEQRAAESLVLAEVARRLGTTLSPRVVEGMSFDGYSDTGVLVEVWAHQGPPKPAQKHKVMADALKLVWGDRVLSGGQGTKVLAMADKDAAAPFLSGTWMAAALTGLGIRVEVIDVGGEVRSRINAAQTRQATANR